jgi:hypothetical protein
LEVCSPRRDELQQVLEVLGFDMQVSAADHPRLSASVAGPRGKLDLSS